MTTVTVMMTTVTVTVTMTTVMVMKNTGLQSVLDALTNFISPAVLWSRRHYFFHFVDEEIEAQRVQNTPPIMELGKGRLNIQIQAFCTFNTLL